MKKSISGRLGGACLLASSALITASILAGPVLADDCTIDTQETQTNGNCRIVDGDKLEITAEGSITVTGDQATGVRVGNNNEVTNHGQISATIEDGPGDNTRGIVGIGNGNVLTNRGGITVTGASAAGMLVEGNANTLTNHSIINTRDDGLVANGDNNRLHNLGVITGASNDAGMWATGSFNVLINDGDIRARTGIQTSGSDTIIINTGDILADEGNSAPGQDGILASGSRNTITNAASGTIRNAVVGIQVFGDQNDVTNSGSILAIASGIIAKGNQNKLTNSGDIRSGGNGIVGEGAGNTLANPGTIRAANVAVDARGDSNSLRNAGEIEATVGLRASGSLNTLENAGRITASAGLSSTGNSNHLKNAIGGVINATDVGLKADGNNNILINEGEINADPTGIEVEGVNSSNNTAINSGKIVALNGIIIGGEKNTAINSGDILNRTIAGSTGMSAGGNGHTLENFGTIDAGLHGIRVTGDFNTATNHGDLGGFTSIIAEGRKNILANTGTILARGNGIWVDGDENELFNAGSITTEGFGNGLTARGNFNTLTNVGSVSAGRGFDADGDRNVLLNYGSLTNSIDGMDVDGDFNKLFNFGEIQGPTGLRTFGDSNLLSNYGTVTGDIGLIAGTGTLNVVENFGRIDAVRLGLQVGGEGNTIVNSGAITITSAEVGTALYAGGNGNTVQNAGSINSAMDGLLVQGDRNELFNSGRISSVRNGISVEGTGNIVENSGFVSAEKAIDITGAGNTLNLRAPSFLAGRIDLGEGGNTVNITPGASHSVVWDFDGVFTGGAPNVTGATPFFFNAATGQFATLDTTSFAAAFDSLGDMTGLLSNVGREGLSGRLSSGYGAAYGMKDGATGDQAAAYRQGLWVTPFGGRFQHEGGEATLGREITQTGVALGYRWEQHDGFGLGVMAGYAQDQSEAASRFAKSHDGEAGGGFAGVSARRQWGNLFLDFALTGGVMSHEQKRFINDNLAENGRAFAEASFDSHFLSPEAGLSMSFDAGNGFSLVPGGRIRYAAQWLDGYAESGSNGSATVDDRMIGLIEASAEIAAVQKLNFGSVTARLGILGRTSVGDDTVGVKVIKIDETAGFGAGNDIAGYTGLGASFDATETLKLQFDGQAIFGDEITGIQGQARITQRF
jgi:hypothetical protein